MSTGTSSFLAATATSAMSADSLMGLSRASHASMTNSGASSPDVISPRPRRIFLSQKVLDASALGSSIAAEIRGDNKLPVSGALESQNSQQSADMSSQRPAGSLSFAGSAAEGGGNSRTASGSQNSHSIGTDVASGGFISVPSAVALSFANTGAFCEVSKKKKMASGLGEVSPSFLILVSSPGDTFIVKLCLQRLSQGYV